MKNYLTPSLNQWILRRKLWITTFVILFFTINATFSKDNNPCLEELNQNESLSIGNPNPSVQVSELINKDLWNTLFPYRFGAKDTGEDVWVLDPADDFYTYESFIEAINRMSKIKVIFTRRCGTNAYKVTRIDKTTNVSVLIRSDADFDAPRNINKEIVTKEVDYGTFLEEGNLEARKREITAFFANISHETTGGWPTAPGGRFSWGLHFREEPTNASYASNDVNYPPTPGKSYKGRGPIQLSYNYNYGPASEFIFGDKQVLLDNPERVIEDAALAFQTAIWFWMTPQYPKPSAHDVMVSNWVPNSLDISKNRVPGLGMTVNVINGGVECGQVTEKPQVVDRIGYYQRFTEIYGIGTDMDGVNDLSDCGCKDMSNYGGDAADLTAEPCAQKPQVSFTSPTNNQMFEQATFSPIPVSLSIDEKDTKLESVTTAIGSETFNGVIFNWTPSSYANHTLTTNAVFENGLTITSSIQVTIWDGVNLDCEGVLDWNATTIYKNKHNYVKFGNKVYRNKWYADSSNTPGTGTVWEFVKKCGISNGSAPVVTWQSPSNGQVIEQTTLSPITLRANATDADGTIQSFVFKQNTTNITAILKRNSYEALFTPTAFGTFTVVASGTDNDNKNTEETITFTVKKLVVGNNPPTVSIVSPINNTSFNVGEVIMITANASDSDGTISKVEFLNKGNKIGESTSSPYSYTIANAIVGDYVITARATDNKGVSSVSSIISIKVSEVATGCTGTQYVAGTNYGLNEEVINEGGKFKCTISGWCSSSAAWAYAPGTGAHWEMAWVRTGTCSSSAQRTLITSSLYPTVTEGVVNLKIETEKASKVKVDVYTISGHLIDTQFFKGNVRKGMKSIKKDLSSFKKGFYILKIHVDNAVFTEKVFKK